MTTKMPGGRGHPGEDGRGRGRVPDGIQDGLSAPCPRAQTKAARHSHADGLYSPKPGFQKRQNVALTHCPRHSVRCKPRPQGGQAKGGPCEWAERTVAPEAGGSGEGPLGPSGEMMTQGPEPGAQGPGRARKHMQGEPRAAASRGLSGRPA